jgi:dolichol-phosphate mannosyltransferase
MIIIALPAYDEELALPPLLDAIAAVRASTLPDLRVIVVDDGSKDGTASVVRTYSKTHDWVDLVQHDGNKGLAEAMKTCFRSALLIAKPGDIIVTCDADNTQPPDTIPGMVKRINEDELDVVIASRFRPGAKVYGVPAFRQLTSVVMSVMFQIALPVRGVRDYSCGFRAYRAQTLRRASDTYGEAFITEKGFACMVEILMQISHLPGVKFGEVPFILHYDLKPTPTKMRVGRTISDTLRLAARHRFGRTSR